MTQLQQREYIPITIKLVYNLTSTLSNSFYILFAITPGQDMPKFSVQAQKYFLGLTAKDMTRLIMPSLSSPCLPLKLYHSSTTVPSRRPSGIVTCVHAMRSSMENALCPPTHNNHQLGEVTARIVTITFRFSECKIS